MPCILYTKAFFYYGILIVNSAIRLLIDIIKWCSCRQGVLMFCFYQGTYGIGVTILQKNKLQFRYLAPFSLRHRFFFNEVTPPDIKSKLFCFLIILQTLLNCFFNFLTFKFCYLLKIFFFFFAMLRNEIRGLKPIQYFSVYKSVY